MGTSIMMIMFILSCYFFPSSIPTYRPYEFVKWNQHNAVHCSAPKFCNFLNVLMYCEGIFFTLYKDIVALGQSVASYRR
jgi:hypothetical protein